MTICTPVSFSKIDKTHILKETEYVLLNKKELLSTTLMKFICIYFFNFYGFQINVRQIYIVFCYLISCELIHILKNKSIMLVFVYFIACCCAVAHLTHCTFKHNIMTKRLILKGK